MTQPPMDLPRDEPADHPPADPAQDPWAEDSEEPHDGETDAEPSVSTAPPGTEDDPDGVAAPSTEEPA